MTTGLTTDTQQERPIRLSKTERREQAMLLYSDFIESMIIGIGLTKNKGELIKYVMRDTGLRIEKVRYLLRDLDGLFFTEYKKRGNVRFYRILKIDPS